MKNRNIQRGQIQMIQQKHPRENMQQRLNGKYESKEYEKTIIIKHTKLMKLNIECWGKVQMKRRRGRQRWGHYTYIDSVIKTFTTV